MAGNLVRFCEALGDSFLFFFLFFLPAPLQGEEKNPGSYYVDPVAETRRGRVW